MSAPRFDAPFFPASVGNEPYDRYAHDRRHTMLVYVLNALGDIVPESEHIAWRIVTDLAVQEMNRPLREAEYKLVTSCVRDIFIMRRALAKKSAHRDTQERLNQPGRLFS